jgi:hypothetical protein
MLRNWPDAGRERQPEHEAVASKEVTPADGPQVVQAGNWEHFTTAKRYTR